MAVAVAVATYLTTNSSLSPTINTVSGQLFNFFLDSAFFTQVDAQISLSSLSRIL